ncbi:MAG: 1-acyl-sn-glycerol-3-phosphate acyltransferase [Bacteroidales bacterium]|jgi:putative hemolysin|nr:1-acyl-sn-glycerol-3-phosphate acyltransferase [Bacteroidales bacterium]MCU0408524.1 1-acyl-sn-glycerol-3-phosphate acyltransferase [Bacteroidales bacterium]
MEKPERIIDIRKAIRSSRSRFVRALPGFVIRLIEKLIRQDDMNATIYRHRAKSGVPFINDILDEWNVKRTVRGSENIPAEGRFVFVANHPVGAMDALSFLSMIYDHFPDVISPSNDLFNYIPNLNEVCLGVNVFGMNTKETAEKLNNLFESDRTIMIFPSGEVSRRVKGVISDPPWQKTFITKSVQYKRDIIPVHISGRNSELFYATDRLRKFLGIKIPIEIILLPREMHRQKNSEITLTVGKPVKWESITRDRTHGEWAGKIMESVHAMG